MTAERLIIRADASAALGAGHVMRCLAISQEHAGETILVTRSDPLVSRVVSRWPVHAASPSEFHDVIRHGDTVVIDGYHFGERIYREAKELGATVVGVGDRSSVPPGECVDVVVDQSSDPDEVLASPAAIVLAGPRNSLVRSEFRRFRRPRDGPLRRVLVAMGGSDPSGLGPPLAAALAERHGDIEVTLLVGPGAVAPEGKQSFAVIDTPESVAAVADTADLAVTAAGTATWEFACMGLPLVTIAVAENQQCVGDRVGAAGVALDAASDDVLRVAPEIIESLRSPSARGAHSLAALQLVDGMGPRRVLDAARASRR